MEHYGECRFCNIVNGKYQFDGIDQPFLSNNEFIAIASIGAMIEGWSLIVPKDHQLSLRNIYKQAGFAEVVENVASLLISHYGPLIAFEHGANKEGSLTSCGTDHSHLHLVPFSGSLISELYGSNLKWIQCHSSEISDRVGDSEYLFYTELGLENTWLDPVGYLHILERPISQFFRHIIAKQINRVNVSNYKQFPHLETAMQTYRVLTR